MKIQSFYSFNRFLKNSKEVFDFNSYGNVLNFLFFETEISKMFAEIKGLREFRLFFEKSINYDGIDDQHLKNGYYLSPPFLENPFLTPKSILPFFVDCGNVDWETLTASAKKTFLIEKWILFFENLPEHYLLVSKEKIRNKTLDLLNIDWKIQRQAHQKSIIYNSEKFEPYIQIDTEKTRLYLVSDTVQVFIKEYETHDFFLKCEFYAIKLKGEILTVEPLFINEITEVNFKQLLEAERKQQGNSNPILD